MGKIFDALEKNRKAAGSPEVSSYVEPDKRKTVSIDADEPATEENPRLPVNDFDPNLIAYHSPRSVEAEQFRILKTKILFPENGIPPKTIMVTSALPGEGKSFIAANLSVSLAQSIDEYVLLMDCDMRIPSVHRLFGYDEGRGLSDYLVKGGDLGEYFIKTPIDKLTVLPGGRIPHNPSELLSSEQMSLLLSEVKNRYQDRYIVIDSPPPRLTAETRAIASQVDAIIVVVKSGDTSRENVKQLVETVGREKIIGVVMNHFDMRLSSYYAYGKYGSYYG